MAKFNQKIVCYRTEKKKKERVRRKLVGSVEKHLKAVKAVSGKRTKKAQRRAVHHAHVNQLDAEKHAEAEAASAPGTDEMAEAGPVPVSEKVFKRRERKKRTKAQKPAPMQE